MLINKIILLVSLILITRCSKVLAVDHHNDVDDNEHSENEYKYEDPSVDGPDNSAINIHEPYMNILDEKVEDRTIMEHFPPLKRSDNPLPNPPLPNNQGGVNMSNPLSKYHCPVNLLYGNNLTAKNFFLLIPRFNMSANDTLEEINKSEIQQAGIQEDLITISSFTSQKEIDSYNLKPTEPQTQSSTELFGISSSNGEYGVNKTESGNISTSDSVTSTLTATGDTVSVTVKGETTYSVNGETTVSEFNNSETIESVTSSGEKSSSVSMNNEQINLIINNKETSGSVFNNGDTTTITEDTTGSLFNNEGTKSIIVDKTSSCTVKSETITDTNINGGTSSSIFHNGETIALTTNSGENTGTVTENVETTNLMIDNAENRGSSTHSTEAIGVISRNFKMTENIFPSSSTHVTIKEKEGSKRICEKSTLVDETTKVPLDTETSHTTLSVNDEALRTIDKYCETFSLVLSYRGTYTCNPVNVDRKPAEDILNDISKFKAYMPGISEKKKRTVFNKNRRKYFRNNIENVYI